MPHVAATPISVVAAAAATAAGAAQRGQYEKHHAPKTDSGASYSD